MLIFLWIKNCPFRNHLDAERDIHSSTVGSGWKLAAGRGDRSRRVWGKAWGGRRWRARLPTRRPRAALTYSVVALWRRGRGNAASMVQHGPMSAEVSVCSGKVMEGAFYSYSSASFHSLYILLPRDH